MGSRVPGHRVECCSRRLASSLACGSSPSYDDDELS